MRITTTNSTFTSSLETKGTSHWESLTNVLLACIFDYVRDIKDLVNLKQVNKHYNRVGLGNTKFGFFNKKYSYNPNIRELMLLPSCINAPHIRAGNQLVKQAIIKINAGDFKIDALLNRAMYRHGSYLAMELILMLSNLGGRVKFNFDMEGLIKLYRENVDPALQQEIELAFQDAEDRRQYVTEMRSALSFFEEEISKHINAFRRSYHLPHTPFQEELHKEYPLTDLLDKHFPPLISKEFDAVGFIGYEKPKNETVWYLQTASQKEFIKTQQIIDTSFTDIAQTTPSHQHPRMIAR